MSSKPTHARDAATGRREFLRKSGAVAVAASLPAFYIGSAAAQETLKVGMVLAKQGPFALQGGDLTAGMQLAFSEAAGKILGRPAELVWADEPNPQGAVQNITKLIEEQKVVAVVGGTSSATALAMGAVANRARIPFITPNAAAREITGKDCNPFMFRMPATVPVYAKAMAPHLLALGKKWYFIAGAFTFGEDVITSFSEIVNAAGGSVVGVDRAPVGTTDYSSFVLKARAAKPDVVISGAANVEPLLKQFKQLGLTGRIALAGPAVSDTDLWSASPDALTGVYGKTWYYNDPNNSPQEKAFARAYMAKEGKPPSDRVFFGWHAMRLLLAAMRNANSAEPLRIAKALEELKLEDGGLPVSFRKWDHQLLRPLVVASARPNPANKWDILDVKATRPANAQALDAMYGSEAEVGCKMAAL
jgi:branched-chain amino acid transport system substrate-binding protein